MNVVWSDPSCSTWQWINIAIGVIGFLITCFSMWMSWLAAGRALDASRAADEARNAARNLAKHDRLQDLKRDFEELHHLVDLPIPLSIKCNRLKDTIVALKVESAAHLNDQAMEELSLLLLQLSELATAAINATEVNSKTRQLRLSKVFSSMAESLSLVVTTFGLRIMEVENAN